MTYPLPDGWLDVATACAINRGPDEVAAEFVGVAGARLWDHEADALCPAVFAMFRALDPDVAGVEVGQIAYQPAGARVPWHVDLDDEHLDRRLVASIPLNAGYTGGVLLVDGRPVAQVPGSAVAWPVDVIHEVTAVTAGERLVYVTRAVGAFGAERSPLRTWTPGSGSRRRPRPPTGGERLAWSERAATVRARPETEF